MELTRKSVLMPTRLLAFAFITAGVAGCPATRDTTPHPAKPSAASSAGTPAVAGVTAAQVRALLDDKFNAIDRSLALWNIQPDLGTVMVEYGHRFALAKHAVDAGDWGMAQYQIKEQIEIQEVSETTRPATARLLDDFEHSHLGAVLAAVTQKDKTAFDAAYTAAVKGCNMCHAVSDYPFIKFVAPADSPDGYLKLAASEPATAEEEEQGAAKGAPADAADRPLTWPELAKLVDGYFNKVTRQLALWNIQPGLGTVMMEYGRRFALAKHAVDAGDWGMAQYQIKEQIEIQEVGETTRPAMASLLKNFEHHYLDALSTAIVSHDTDAFNKAYGAAIRGCNGCHAMTGHPHIRFQMPPASPQPFLKFVESKSGPAKNASPPETTPHASLPGNPSLDDAKQMIDSRFNIANRGLALWNIQPGLGTIMQQYGYHFGNIWFAAQAGNWSLAAYQLKEQIEIQEVGEITRPDKAKLLKNFERSYLDAVAKAIDVQDKAGFEKAYNAAMAGCNACHVATGHNYVRYVIPEKPPATFLNMSGK